MIRKTRHGAGSLHLNTLPKRHSDIADHKSPFFSLSQLAERFAVRFAIFARLYFNVFYRTMLAREVALASLKPGASVLHIGGGAYPYTAIFLARRGYRVQACDCDSTAVEISKKLVVKSGLIDQISISYENGCKVDSSGYDAVWVSLNICPKERVLEQSWASLKEGGILVYRRLPAWLALFDKSDVILNVEGNRIKKARSGLGAESLIAKKVKILAEGREKISALN
jgi:2-polyprenyl-3-methyl-5-hydroxy-6-metoxy-1,4-benzoquinol methylase